MADDFQVKQGVNTQSSSGAYGLTGGIIGAAAGGFGAHYLTKPQYSSYEDIIKEAKDSADFKSKIDKAEGEEKKFFEAAKAVADEKANAEKIWDEEFKAYQEANKEGLIKDDNFKELEAKQAEYQGKIKELETKTTEKTEMVTEKKDPIAALRNSAKKADADRKEFFRLKDSNAPKEAIDKARARMNESASRLEKTIESIVESSQYKAKSEASVNTAKQTLKTELQDYVRNYLDEREKYSEMLKQLEKNKPDALYKEATKNIAKQEKSINDALAKIKELSNKDLTNSLKDGYKNFDNRIEAIIKSENNKADVLKNLLKLFPSDKKVVEGVTARELCSEFLSSLWNNKPMNLKGTTVFDPEKAMQDFIDTLRPNEKALLNGKEVTRENIEELIKESETRVNAIKEAAQTVRTSTASLNASNMDIIKAKNEIVKKYGEGTYFNEKGEIVNRNVESLKEEKVPEFKPKQFKPTNKTALPNEIEVKYDKKIVTEAPELAEVRKKLEEINKQIEAAKNDLNKGELKPEEQLANFAKEKGVKDKEEFLTNSVKEKAEKFGKEYESQFKRKFGFAEHANWKIAGAAAAGALVLGGIFSLFAPKNRS